MLDEEAVQEEEDLLSDGRIRFSQAFHDLVHVVLEGSLKGNGINMHITEKRRYAKRTVRAIPSRHSISGVRSVAFFSLNFSMQTAMT